MSIDITLTSQLNCYATNIWMLSQVCTIIKLQFGSLSEQFFHRNTRKVLKQTTTAATKTVMKFQAGFYVYNK